MSPRKKSKDSDKVDEGSDHGPGKDLDKNGKYQKNISKDFMDRWKKLEDSSKKNGSLAEEEGEAPTTGLGLFKRKMEERKGKRPEVSFLHPGFSPKKPTTPKKEKTMIEEKTKTIEPSKDAGRSSSMEKIQPPNKKVDVLDTIMMELRSKKDEFLQRRREEIKEEAARPKEETAPHLGKVDILKLEMTKKKKDDPKTDLFGIGFGPQLKRAREDQFAQDEEKVKSDLKAVMDRTMRSGSIVKHLDEVLNTSLGPAEDEYEAVRSRVLDDLKDLEIKGYEGRIKKIVSKVSKGNVFEAEKDLMHLKIAIEGDRARKQLKTDREERLEAHLANLSDGDADLENVVTRHIKAIEIEMDQTKARIDRDLRKMDCKGFEHVVNNIKEMVKEDRVFEAEEQLLELRLALKARSMRKEMKRYRGQRILEKGHDTLLSKWDKGAPEGDLDTSLDLSSVEEELKELMPPEEEGSEDRITEVQCGVCGTILPESVHTCPACGASFRDEGVKEGPGVPGVVPGEEILPELRAVGDVHPPLKDQDGIPVKDLDHLEISEVQCGVCGSIVPANRYRCSACGTTLFEPMTLKAHSSIDLKDTDRYPVLEPVEEGTYFSEQVPMDEMEAYQDSVPLDEMISSPELVPVEEIRCSKCGELTPADSEFCDHCATPLIDLPILSPVTGEEDFPELVPIGPDELVSGDLSPDYEEVPVYDLSPEIIVSEEVEPEHVAELVAEPEEDLEPFEASAWVDDERTMKEFEWRRLVVRGKRFYEDGLVKEALEAYDDALDIEHSYEAYFGKGTALLSLGWSNSALDCFNHALGIDENRVEGWIQKAKAQEALSRYGEAVDSLSKALALDRDHAEAWRLKGALLLQMGKIKEAVFALDQFSTLQHTEKALQEVVEITEEALAEGIIGVEPVSAGAVADEIAAVEEEELRSLKPKRYRSLSKSRGLTNGLALVNGRGLTNGSSLINGRRSLVNGRRTGLTNGRPLVNGKRGSTNGLGKGLVNGRGLVNGASGLINGKSIADVRGEGPIIRFKPKGRKRRALQALAILMVIVIGIGIIPLNSYLNPGQEGIVIDGQFSDWQNSVMYDDTNGDQSINRDLDIIHYSMSMDTKSISFLVEVPQSNKILQGAGHGVDVIHVFLETDGSSSTGYSIMGLGADLMLEIIGWDGKVDTARQYSFNTSDQRSQQDWNGWIPGPSIRAISKGNRIEVQVSRAELDAHKGEDVLALIYLSDSSGNNDIAEHILARSKGVLGIRYDHINPKIIQPNTQNIPFLRMNLSAHKSQMEVSSITFIRTGRMPNDLALGPVRLWTDRDLSGDLDVSTDAVLATNAFAAGPVSSDKVILIPENPLLVQPETILTLFVTIDILDLVPMSQTLGMDIEQSDVDVVRGAVTVTKSMAFNSYIGNVTQKIIIDGVFDDWDRVMSQFDADSDIEIPRIDLMDYRSDFDDDTVSFYLRTKGEIMMGMVVPENDNVRPTPPIIDDNATLPPPPGQLPELPVLTGADIAIIYIDADRDHRTGSTEYGLPIGADFKLRIEGKSGSIFSTKLLKYIDPLHGGPRWDEVSTFVPAANDRFRIETQVTKEALGLPSYGRVDAFFMISDWEDNYDLSDDILLGNRGTLDVGSLDVIPDTIRSGALDVALLGLDLQSGEDVLIEGIGFDRTGNTTDMATSTLNLYKDNGDRLFNIWDKSISLSRSRFSNGRAQFSMDPPMLVQAGSTVTVFLAADITFNGEDETLGVQMGRDDIISSARSTSGPFPISTFVSAISSDSDRGTNLSVNYTDNALDNSWGNIGPNSEGYTNDNWLFERWFIPKPRDIRDVEISDNGSWLNFHVRTRNPTNANIHIYIDSNNNTSADYDLVYNITSGKVMLYAFNYSNSSWGLVNITNSTDRSDKAGVHLEMGIEFSYINLTQSQTLNYIVHTEADTTPGGAFFDSAPGLFGWTWTTRYTTIPEFSDLVIPIAGIIIIFTIVQRKRGQRARKRSINRRCIKDHTKGRGSS